MEKERFVGTKKKEECYRVGLQDCGEGKYVNGEEVVIYSTLTSGPPGGGPDILISPFLFIPAFSNDT